MIAAPAIAKAQRETFRLAWKAIAKYGRRSLIESTFASFKANFGGTIQAIKQKHVMHEVAFKIDLYNTMLDVAAEAIESA